uniref:A to I editase domain-containing protein n=1 Tax=Hydatigena taeniaeformis TaxID=6205 RepID=A0A0R3X7V1_HYDTA
LIEKLHDEAPPLCNGVILSKTGRPEEKMGKAHHPFFSKGANLFIGSCAYTAVDGDGNESDRNVDTHRTVSHARKQWSIDRFELTPGSCILKHYLNFQGTTGSG